MTQTSTSEPTPTRAGMFPRDRYGRRREPRQRSKWVIPALVVAGVAVMSLIAVKLYFEYGNDKYSANVMSSTQITNSSITVIFSVAKSDGAPATCTVQAFSYHNTQVGQAQVPVPAGKNVTVTTTLKTTSRAYIGEVPACQPVK